MIVNDMYVIVRKSNPDQLACKKVFLTDTEALDWIAELPFRRKHYSVREVYFINNFTFN